MSDETTTLQVKIQDTKLCMPISKEKHMEGLEGNSGKMLTVDVSKYEDALPTL